jgi:hypothetical protein
MAKAIRQSTVGTTYELEGHRCVYDTYGRGIELVLRIDGNRESTVVITKGAILWLLEQE